MTTTNLNSIRADSPVWPADAERIVCRLTVPGQPTPKARPRVVGTNVYTTSSSAEDDIRRLLRRKPVSCLVEVRAAFYRSDRRRVDLDNLVKLVTDAANGFLWVDDSQIHSLHAWLFRGAREPRTELLVLTAAAEPKTERLTLTSSPAPAGGLTASPIGPALDLAMREWTTAYTSRPTQAMLFSTWWFGGHRHRHSLDECTEEELNSFRTGLRDAMRTPAGAEVSR